MSKRSRKAGESSHYDEIKAALKRYYRFNELSKVIKDGRCLKRLQKMREHFSKLKEKGLVRVMRDQRGKNLRADPVFFYLRYLISKVIKS
jgi:DNA-binding transcriptional ArsR family regulator